MIERIKLILNDNMLPVYSFIAAGLAILFLTSNQYKTESIISLAKDDSVSLPSSFFSSSLINNASGKDIEELKVFLESGESLNIMLARIDFNSVYGFPKGGLFSSFYSAFGRDSNYLSNKIDIITNSDSGTLSFTTYAFNSQDSYELNLLLISLANYYFTRKQNYSAQLKKMNAMCELAIAQAGNSDEFKDFSDSMSTIMPENVSSFESSSSLLLNTASSYSESCKNYINGRKSTTESSITIFDKVIQTDTEKSIKSDIFKNTVLSLTSSSKVNIVSEPSLARHAESKMIFLNSFLILVLIFSLQITVKVISRVYSDFK